MGVYTNINGVYREVKEAGTSINASDTKLIGVYSKIEAVDKELADFSKLGKVTGVSIRWGSGLPNSVYVTFTNFSGTGGNRNETRITRSNISSYQNFSVSGNIIYTSTKGYDRGVQVYFDIYLLTTKYPQGIIMTDPSIIASVANRLKITFRIYATQTDSPSGGVGFQGVSNATYGYISSIGTNGVPSYGYPNQGNDSWKTSTRTIDTLVTGYAPIGLINTNYAWTTSTVQRLRTLQLDFNAATWDGVSVPITLNI